MDQGANSGVCELEWKAVTSLFSVRSNRNLHSPSVECRSTPSKMIQIPKTHPSPCPRPAVSVLPDILLELCSMTSHFLAPCLKLQEHRYHLKGTETFNTSMVNGWMGG